MTHIQSMESIESALRSPTEEFVDASIHGLGCLLSLVAGLFLVGRATQTGDPWCVGSCAFYISTLVSVYAASTLSHLFFPDRVNRLFRRLDQGFIYLLIVGSFTPFILVYLRTPFWLSFYFAILAVAVGGCISKVFFAHRVDRIAVWLYVTLGWMESLAAIPMFDLVPLNALLWVLYGGLCYSIGVIFLITDVRRWHFHSIWHLLVIAGSACHYYAILRYVVERQS